MATALHHSPEDIPQYLLPVMCEHEGAGENRYEYISKRKERRKE
tara:strand:- start:596 stop:727 length:132 start_codon:yes stop_codon:yes gene_type:complete